jgi:hypothetical protein
MNPGDEQLDYSWVTERVALGGAIWNRANMCQLAGSVALIYWINAG